ncbi:cytochrome c [Methylomonas sp. EFPC3]|uniref:cytochrome c n=1 Tax=Methylomonas sp. EFPC3 TaxID=3021710 RepID=UPI002416FF29|nr:cytochrome c [Methylomonas sp. EFPC3]WFP48694.1 cytochrome c [Methylomonas sp. EFPC3]
MKKIYPILVLSAAVAACSAPEPKSLSSSSGWSQTGTPALHAVRDGKLRELMDRMDSLMHERFMTETQIDAERRKYARQIAETAHSLSANVDAIIASLPGLNLTADEQTAFRALAAKLRSEMGLLQQQAESNRIDQISDNLHEINTTCTSCHALFRKLGG